MTSHKSSTRGRQDSVAFVHYGFKVLGMKHFFIFYVIYSLWRYWRVVLILYSFWNSGSHLSETLSGLFKNMISKWQSQISDPGLLISLCVWSSGLFPASHHCIAAEPRNTADGGVVVVVGWVQMVRAEGKLRCELEPCPGCGSWG